MVYDQIDAFRFADGAVTEHLFDVYDAKTTNRDQASCLLRGFAENHLSPSAYEYDVVRNQPVPATQQLQTKLALPTAGRPAQERAQTVDLHQNAVTAGRLHD